jgi:flagellar biosynthesis protein
MVEVASLRGCIVPADDSKKGRSAKRDIAVALAFRPGAGDPAPKVVASGRGALAREILDRAFANGVKVREDADLVQLLSLVEVDSIIPVEAFMAVAEILAYVYGLNQQAAPAPLFRKADRP